MKWHKLEKDVSCWCVACCLFRLVVRTLPFHGSNGNSIFPRDSVFKQKRNRLSSIVWVLQSIAALHARYLHLHLHVAKRSFAFRRLCTAKQSFAFLAKLRFALVVHDIVLQKPLIAQVHRQEHVLQGAWDVTVFSHRSPSLYGIQRQKDSNTLSWTHFFTCFLV